MVNREGWTCPTCRRNYAPWMPSCSCINSAVGVNTTSITITPHAGDTAELVEFLERIGAFDENLEAANSPELLPCFDQRLYDEWKQLSIAARAALARVKGGAK